MSETFPPVNLWRLLRKLFSACCNLYVDLTQYTQYTGLPAIKRTLSPQTRGELQQDARQTRIFKGAHKKKQKKQKQKK